MKNMEIYSVFISSPSDTEEERKEVSEVIEHLNSHLNARNICLQPIKWETSIHPQTGQPQTIINRLLPESDLCITILKNKLGTPTVNHKSGTVEETKFFLDKHKTVMLYLYKNQEAETPKDVEDFVEEIRENILYSEYKDISDFKFKLYHHLSLRFSGEDGEKFQKDVCGLNTSIFVQFVHKKTTALIKSRGVVSITDNGVLDFTINFENEIEIETLVITGYPTMAKYQILSPSGKQKSVRIKLEEPDPDIITITSLELT